MSTELSVHTAIFRFFGNLPKLLKRAYQHESVAYRFKEHPAVNEVGVAAIPHPEKTGEEALKAWIVLNEGTHPTVQDLIDHCGQYLAPYEVPRRYAFIDALPKSEVLKTLRTELVRMELEERARG